MSNSKKRHVEWTVSQVADVRSAVRDEVAHLSTHLNPNQVQAHLSDLILRLSASRDGTSALRVFHCALALLLHHLKHGGLSIGEIKTTFSIAQATLFANGISPIRSRLGFLHGDLQVLKSQLFKRNGEHLQAAWAQHLASRHIYGNNAASSEIFNEFVSKLRLESNLIDNVSKMRQDQEGSF